MDCGRISRSKKQRMYLLDYDHVEDAYEFKIEGSTGTAYFVSIDEERFHCTCPDFKHRHMVCKHGFFVASRVFRNEDLLDLLESEEMHKACELLSSLYSRLSTITSPSITCEESASERIEPRDPHCLICYDEFEKDTFPELCPNRHGFHVECMDRWRMQQRMSHSDDCPLCRCSMKRRRGHGELGEDEEDDALTKLPKPTHVEETVASVFRDVGSGTGAASPSSPQHSPQASLESALASASVTNSVSSS
jgi:hypothetical protein